MKTQKITLKGGKEEEKARKEAGREDGGKRERGRERLILHFLLHLTPVAPVLSSHPLSSHPRSLRKQEFVRNWTQLVSMEQQREWGCFKHST